MFETLFASLRIRSSWRREQPRYKYHDEAIRTLNRIWSPPPPPSDDDLTLSYSRFSMEPPATVQPPPWLIGFGDSFNKDIAHVDKTLQGRILSALADLATSPLEFRGDTVKPLRGVFRDCWRYRIGDYRLVFRPNRRNGAITLLAFASRGSIYDD
jgi:mRNA-degrading endonuclease RelE of RelBE toxin-antitoxin system